MFNFTPKSRLIARIKSGQVLGRVIGIEVDPATGRIEHFVVASQYVLPRLLDKTLIVAWSQVIEWKEDEIIVADTVLPVGASVIAFASPQVPNANMKEQA
ncbi:MAG: hypothetical protein WCW31_05110 [Patescibacteria group bacterium]|jgi:sporulation protein YlmC with PRC-barrel domain